MKNRHRGRALIAVGVLAALTATTLAAPAGSVRAAPSEGPDGEPRLSKKERKRIRLKKLRRANRKQKRPNFVVINTDDQDNSLEGLPNIYRLLIQPGTTFSRSYVSFPLCCPSRATFLTGQYAHNHGVFTSDSPVSYNSLRHNNTLPIWLRRSGYRTVMVGKYLNGYGINDRIPERRPDAKEIPRGWAEWYALTGGTDQRRYRYKLNENGRVRKYGKGGRNYVTDVLASKVVRVIKRRAPRPKPLFLWFNPTAPHGESNLPFGATRDPTPAIRHFGRYQYAIAPRTPNFDEADVSDKPQLIRGRDRLTPDQIADVDRRQRGRLESLLAVDDALKRIVGKLKKAGDLRKTYIIFTSDNGLLLGSHRLLFKGFLYEESTRVPLVIRGPRFPRGAVRNQLVSNVDLAPTIVELARVRPGLTMDGRSLIPFAHNPAYGAARETLFESYTTDSVGIRSGRWIYLEHDSGERELYDLQRDPWQLESLHDDPLHASIRNQLKLRVAQLRHCAGAGCP